MARDIAQRLRAAHSLLRTATEQALAAAGMSQAQLAVLEVLARSPGATSATLARECGITPQSMMELVHRLEGQGLLARGETRGRAVALHLTGAGEEAARRGPEIVAAVEESLTARLRPGDLAELRALLEQVELNLARRAAPGRA